MRIFELEVLMKLHGDCESAYWLCQVCVFVCVCQESVCQEAVKRCLIIKAVAVSHHQSGQDVTSISVPTSPITSISVRKCVRACARPLAPRSSRYSCLLALLLDSGGSPPHARPIPSVSSSLNHSGKHAMLCPQALQCPKRHASTAFELAPTPLQPQHARCEHDHPCPPLPQDSAHTPGA